MSKKDSSTNLGISNFINRELSKTVNCTKEESTSCNMTKQDDYASSEAFVQTNNVYPFSRGW